MEKEVWKDIPNYKGFYQVSNLGRVKSLRFGKERILKPSYAGKGYSMVIFTKDKVRKPFYVHVLVAMAFLKHKPCGHKLVVDHKNNINTDNRLENLQITSQRHNASKDRKGYSSQYVGVYWHKPAQKWVAQIQIKDKRKNLGLFDDEYKAHLAYQKALRQLK